MATTPIAGGKPAAINSNPGVQELSIQWLSLKRVQKYTELTEDQILKGPLGNVVKRIIEIYNQGKPKKDQGVGKSSTQSADEAPEAEEPEIAGEKESKKIHYEHLDDYKFPSSFDYQVHVYQHVEKTKSRLVKNLEAGGVNEDRLHKRKSTNFLLFFFRDVPRREIVAATTGNAWEAIRDCVNYSAPIKVAERILDPNRIVVISRKCLLGPGILETIHNPFGWEGCKIANIYYQIESFRCVAKTDSSFMELLKLKKPLEITIRTGNLRIHRRTPLDQYPAILDLFSKYLLGRATYHGKGIQESKDPRFEFLHFLKPVPAGEKKLDLQLATQMFNAFEADQRQPFSFRHKYFQDYFNSDLYEIKHPHSSRFEKLEGRPDSVEEILRLIQENDDKALLTTESFYKTLEKTHFRYQTPSHKKERGSLLDYLEGEVRDTEGNAYFKIRGLWFKLALDYHALLKEDFKGLLRQALIKPDEEGQLPRFWKGNKPQGQLTESKLKKKFGISKGIRDFFKKLKESKVSLVDKKGNVKQKKLVGEILKIPVVMQFKDTIEEGILAGDKIPSDDEIEELLDGHADEVLNELRKERLVVEKNKKRETYVINPFPYFLAKSPILEGKYDEFVQYLEELAIGYLEGAEDEETYNRSYLRPPFGHTKGYLVFDQICPHNIEPCDVIKFTKDTTYLYHIKETFGQHTRDACSQILNAAKEFRSALSVQQADNFIQLLWNMSTEEDLTGWKLEVKQQLDALGKEEFFKIFQERKIVFVYALLGKPHKSLYHEVTKKSKLTPEDLPGTQEEQKNYFEKLKNEGFFDSEGRITGKFDSLSQPKFEIPDVEKKTSKAIYDKVNAYSSISNSTLAKFEVLNVAREVRALGFEFKICEIQQASLEMPSESWIPDSFDSSFLEMNETSSLAASQTPDIIDNGPTGLLNIGNSCYMNATLQVIFNVPEIRQQIEAFEAEEENHLIPLLKQIMEPEEASDEESSHSIDPKATLKQFRDEVFRLKGKGELTGGKTTQQDAHEFLQFILEKLDWKPIKLRKKFKTEDEEWYSRSEPTHHLSIGMTTTGTFQDALNAYFAFEEMDADTNDKLEPLQRNEWEYSQWEQKESIKEPLPSHLIIHLKKFDERGQKIVREIKFPEDHIVQIQNEEEEDVEYEIVGFINHHGKTAKGGHYTADVKNYRDQAGQERWIHCDDEQLKTIAPAEKDAYLVVLKKVEEEN